MERTALLYSVSFVPHLISFWVCGLHQSLFFLDASIKLSLPEFYMVQFPSFVPNFSCHWGLLARERLTFSFPFSKGLHIWWFGKYFVSCCFSNVFLSTKELLSLNHYLDKYHAWVNAEFLLEKCLVGMLDDSHWIAVKVQ